MASEEQRRQWRENSRAWRAKNPERHKELAAASYARHRDKRVAYQRARIAAMSHEEAERERVKRKAYYKVYYERNRERILARNRLVKQLRRSLGLEKRNLLSY